MNNINFSFSECTVDTVIVGSGCAAYNTADSLLSAGYKDILLVTENRLWGTSRNAGSDKQTYYRVSATSNTPDCSKNMADTLFLGSSVDEDNATVEASLSERCFYKLVELGVPFPFDNLGRYVGYKTDHDEAARGTSAGPYTSRLMTEALEKSAISKGLKIEDGQILIHILQERDICCGIITMSVNSSENQVCYKLIKADNVVLATGGPGGIYKNNVYPTPQFGATGIAFKAGAKGQNLTEWQFGLASINPKWNVSGSYMQVLPRFISTEKYGSDEKEFLYSSLTQKEVLNYIFLKGYQWPFDVKKVNTGSSIIDILVFLELEKGRRVFLDYRNNPFNKDIEYSTLSQEAYEYLDKAGICFGTPFDRLKKLNSPAIDFYLDHGIDLSSQLLEISFCAQHNNGGIAVDSWWQSNIKGLYVVGEASGTHGGSRPGGSALNETQVGSLRAALHIQYKAKPETINTKFSWNIINEDLKLLLSSEGLKIPSDLYSEVCEKMSSVGSAFRNTEDMENLRSYLSEELIKLETNLQIRGCDDLLMYYRLKNVITTQIVYLDAYIDYAKTHRTSRGSTLYYSKEGTVTYTFLPEKMKFILDDNSTNLIQEISYKDGQTLITWREPRRLIDNNDCFEVVWSNFREKHSVY